METEEKNNIYTERDKWNAPFLLACSFQNLLQFAGSYRSNGVLYWQFAPKDKAELLINQFRSKTTPNVPPLDLFMAIDDFWRQVSGKRNGEKKYGESG